MLRKSYMSYGNLTQLMEAESDAETSQSYSRQQNLFSNFLSLLILSSSFFSLNQNYFYRRSILRIILAFLVYPVLKKEGVKIQICFA